MRLEPSVQGWSAGRSRRRILNLDVVRYRERPAQCSAARLAQEFDGWTVPAMGSTSNEKSLVLPVAVVSWMVTIQRSAVPIW